MPAGGAFKGELMQTVGEWLEQLDTKDLKEAKALLDELTA